MKAKNLSKELFFLAFLLTAISIAQIVLFIEFKPFYFPGDSVSTVDSLKDFYLIMLGLYMTHSTKFFIGMGCVLVMGITVANTLAKKSSLNLPNTSIFFLRSFNTVFFLVFVFLVPLNVFVFSGFQIRPWDNQYRKFWKVITETTEEPRIKVSALRDLDRLSGSSLVYKHAFEAQRFRVVSECDGRGAEKPWENKRTCLLLIAGIAAETFQDFRPGLLGRLASRIVLLATIDGLIRVWSAEGTQSPASIFLISIVKDLGFSPEATELENTQSHAELSDSEKIDSLAILRNNLESEMSDLFQNSKLPQLMQIQFPGPLEIEI
jgi:hypothetical protein